MRLVSVIIPAKNEEKYIGSCLNSLRTLVLDDGWQLEVIVVDNMSTDKTASIAEGYKAKVVSTNSQKMGEIRAFGASIAQGEILAYVDADCEVKSGWLTSALAALECSQVGAVGGYLDLPKSSSFVEKGWALPFKKRFRDNIELVGASFIIRRDVYEKVGGFDVNLSSGEDSELSRRIISFGYMTKMMSDCNVVHFGYPSSVMGFVDRQVWQVMGQFSIFKLFSDFSIFISIVFVLLVFFGFLVLFFDLFLSFILFFMALILLFAFSIKRVLNSGSVPSARDWLSILSVSVFYFWGRFLGVAVSLLGIRYARRYK